jgi:hypothetical protein
VADRENPGFQARPEDIPEIAKALHPPLEIKRKSREQP